MIGTLQEALKDDSTTAVEQELTAKDLKQELSGNVGDRMKERKVIVITLDYGKRPEVEFQGFWNGKLVHNAMNAISRAYRLLRHKNIRVNANTPNQMEDGDVTQK
jgi:hypothetical protein